MTNVAGLVLTGGASRRLGVDKATLVLDGETLAARAARLLTVCCDPVLEVGPGHTRGAAVCETPVGSGPLAALVTGATAMAAAFESVVLLACDLPWVAPVLFELVAASPAALTVPVDEHGRRQYVCARYGPEALVRASAMFAAGERSLRALADALPSEAVFELDGFAAGVFADIDTPGDAEHAGIDLHR